MSSITSTKRVVSAYVQVCGKWKLYEHNTNIRYSSTALLTRSSKQIQKAYARFCFSTAILLRIQVFGKWRSVASQNTWILLSLLSSRPVHNFISHLVTLLFLLLLWQIFKLINNENPTLKRKFLCKLTTWQQNQQSIVCALSATRKGRFFPVS